MDGQKPIHHSPTLVYTEAVSTFVEKIMSHVMLLNERLWQFFTKKEKIYFMVPNYLFWSQMPNKGSAFISEI